MAWLEFRESTEGCEQAQKAGREMTLSILDFSPKQQVRIWNQVSRFTRLFNSQDAKSVIHLQAQVPCRLCHHLPTSSQ